MAESEAHGESAASRPTRRRWRRRIVRALLALLALVVVAAVAGLWCLANLDTPFLKRRIQASAQEALGTGLDFDELGISLFSGLSARGLVIRTPAELAGGAPDLLRIDALDVEIDVWDALTGDIRIPSVRIGPVKASLVADETGRTSLDLLFPDAEPQPEPESKPVKVSRLLESLREGGRFELGELTVEPITLEYVTLDNGAVAARQTLEGVSIASTAALGTDAPTAELVLSTADEGARATMIEVVDGETRERSGRATVDTRLSIAGNRLTLRGSARVLEQTFAESPPTPPSPFDVYNIDLAVDFVPDENRTHVALKTLDLLGDVGAATLDIDAYDRGDGGIARLAITGAGRIGFDTMPVRVPGIELANVDARYDIEKLDLNAAGLAGALSATVKVGRGGYDVAGTTAAVEDLAVDIDVGQSGAFGPSLTVSKATAAIDAASLSARLGDDQSAELSSLRFRYEGENVALPGGVEPERNRAELAIATVNARTNGNRLDLAGTELVLRADGAIAAYVNDRPLDAILSGPLGTVSASAATGERVALDGATIDLDVRGLNLAGQGMLGLDGTAVGEVEIASVDGAVPGQRVSGRDIGLRADVSFDDSAAKGSIPLGRFALVGGGQRTAVRDARLEWSVANPLALAPGSAGSAGARLEGTIAGVDAAGNRVAIPALMVDVRKQGARSYAVDLDSSLSGIAVGDVSLPERRSIKARATADLAADDIALDLDVRGPGKEAVDVDVTATFARQTGALEYNLEVAASELGKLLDATGTASVGGVDSRAANVTLRASGNLRGALVKRPGDLVPAPSADPLGQLRGRQQLRLELAGIAYRDGDTEVTLPGLTITGASEHKAGGASTAGLGVDVPAVSATLGPDNVKVAGFHHDTDVRFDAFPSTDALALVTRTTLERLDHTFVDGYRVADVELAADLTATPTSVRVGSLLFSNPAGRTRLKGTGALERWSDAADPRTDGDNSAIHGRNAVQFAGTLTQDMATFVESGFARRATGTLDVPFEIESGDLVAFRARLAVQPRGVTYVAPDEALVIEDLSGFIPVTQEVLLTDDGIESFARAPDNVVARARFFDVQPFLDIEDYLTANRVSVAGESFGPVAANLRVAGTTLSMDQLQVGYRGGTVTGKLICDYRPGDTTVMFRGNATGIKPSGSDEVFDANAALTFQPDTLALTGKVHLVRLAREHLAEVLDALDPYHTDTAINRVRLGLRVGYPKFARITVKEGLMNAKVELGGAAGVVRLDEIRAIPVAPLLEQNLGPVIDALSSSAASPTKAPPPAAPGEPPDAPEASP